MQSETLFKLGYQRADLCSYHRFFADILLTPLEATRIRLVSQPNYATGLTSSFTRLVREGGVHELYAGFLPILCKFSVDIRPTIYRIHLHRQIPYAIGQFTVNEFCHEAAFRAMSEETRKNLSGTAKFSIQLGSGIIAGFAAAVLSHVGLKFSHLTELITATPQPADALLSQINKGHGPDGSMTHRLGVLARQAGLRGLFAGLGPRMIMTAGLVSGQFVLYGSIKQGTVEPLHLRKTVLTCLS